MGLYHTVSEINGDFSRNCNISHSRVFCAPADGGSRWSWVSALGDKKTRMIG